MEKTRFYQKDRKYIFATAFEQSMSHESFVSDVIIKAGFEKRELYCHRLVLASSSNFLYSVLSSVPPGTTPVILLPDISVSVMELILTYIYYGEVNIPSDKYIEFVAACVTLKIKPGNDYLEENTDNSASEINEKEIQEKRNNETFIEDQPIQNKASKLKNVKSIKNKNISDKKHSKIKQKKQQYFSTNVSVTPELTVLAQEKLILAVRRAYKSLQIRISPKIKKSISESKLVIENDILSRGIHDCGLCGPGKTFTLQCRMYTCNNNTNENLIFLIYNLKKHIKNVHLKVLNKGISKSTKWNSSTKITVTHESALLLQKKLILAIRRRFTALGISVTPKIEKSISDSKIILEDDTLIGGVHSCGFCDPEKDLKINYRIFSIGGEVVFITDVLKNHFFKKHSEFLEFDKITKQ